MIQPTGTNIFTRIFVVQTGKKRKDHLSGHVRLDRSDGTEESSRRSRFSSLAATGRTAGRARQVHSKRFRDGCGGLGRDLQVFGADTRDERRGQVRA